jgi:hypothetical protein
LCFIGPKDSHPNFNGMAIHFQIFIGPWRMRRPLIGAKGFRSFHWTRGTSSRKVKEASKRKDFWCMWGKKKKRRMSVRKIILVLMCGEVLMGKVCVRIKHERNLCSKCLWQSLWTFGSISFFSQIHC